MVRGRVSLGSIHHFLASLHSGDAAVTDFPQASKLTVSAVHSRLEVLFHCRLHSINCTLIHDPKIPKFQRRVRNVLIQTLVTLWLRNVTATHPPAFRRPSAIQYPHATQGLDPHLWSHYALLRLAERGEYAVIPRLGPVYLHADLEIGTTKHGRMRRNATIGSKTQDIVSSWRATTSMSLPLPRFVVRMGD